MASDAPSTRFIVIGGDAAGMSAAAQASRGRRPVQTTVFEQTEFTSYAACGLPYFVAGLIPDADQLVARSPEQHRANGIDVRTRTRATAIDTERKVVTYHSLDDDRTGEESYDQLLIATGASAIRPNLPGIDAKGVSGIHVIPDAVWLDEILSTRSPARAVVVGGGYIGLEMAEAFALRGLDVTMIEMLDQPMATLDPDMGARVADAIRKLGVDLRLGTAVTSFDADTDGWVRAVATPDGTVDADIVVLGLGGRPNVGLARDAGIPIGPSGAIATDARMSTPVEGVWAAGDCAESHHRITGKPAWVALGTHANKHGRVVGLNVSGTPAEFPGVIGTAITKVGDTEIARTGLSTSEAVAAGFDVVADTIDGSTRAHYYPDPATIAVKTVVERGSGRMLGAQIVGGPESGKRIDALAVAIWNEMTADEFGQTDLAYAPPFSPVWDPTMISARRAATRAD